MELVTESYRIAKLLPADERFSLTDQMRRCAVSIPSNIAEGQGRITPGEFRQHLGIARGSTLELETQLDIAVRLTYLTPDQATPSLSLLDEVRRMLNSLIAKI